MWTDALILLYAAASIWAYWPQKFIEITSLRFVITGVKTLIKISNVVVICFIVLYFINKI